ncbi:laccase-like multicopper oxidase, partial [Hortaea werneckii]
MHSLLSFLALALPLAPWADAAASSSKRWARPGRGGFGDRHGGHQWSALSQDKTNGLSHLGKLDAPRLPHFIDGPHPGGSPRPWGNRDAKNCNPYDVNAIPNTGVTRQYDWTVTNTTLAPDGVELPLLVVNGQFPGPTIEANWGDWIEVTVHNQLTGEYEEGTSIHWHGFLQTGTPYYDGTPGISQCPIAPGKSFTYRFRAELYGTSWWHSHYSSQYVNGLSGPIVVYGPDSDSYDIDVGPVM